MLYFLKAVKGLSHLIFQPGQELFPVGNIRFNRAAGNDTFDSSNNSSPSNN